MAIALMLAAITAAATLAAAPLLTDHEACQPANQNENEKE